MINKELIRQARQTDLAAYLEKRGEPLKKDANGRYKHTKHDSLVFTQNAFFWNSQGKSGNAIDFLMLYYKIDFKTALKELTNADLSTKKEPAAVPQPQQVPVSNDFKLPDLNKDMRRAFAYLIKTRFIDKSIVQFLAKEKLLLQDSRNNVVFPWLDENSKVVGAELNGTLDKVRFKGISSGSAYGYGYNIRKGSPHSLYVFESSIDLLSFLSLNKGLQDVLFVSMAGLKKEVIQGFLQREKSISTVYACVDNDAAGQKFMKELNFDVQVKSLLPKNGKDWNEHLKML